MTPTEKAVLQRLKSLIRDRASLHQMVLFGSRARGDGEPDSDMDVLVVLNGPVTRETRNRVSDCAWEAGLGQGLVIVPVVVSRDEWERGPERYSLLADAIRAEGVPV